MSGAKDAKQDVKDAISVPDHVVDGVMRMLVNRLKAKGMKSVDLFKSIDVSGDGSISPEELRVGLNKILLSEGGEITDHEFAAVMLRIDRDGGGEVSLKEFERAMKAAERLPQNKKKDIRQVEVKRKQGLTVEDKEEFRQMFCLFKQLSQSRQSAASGLDEKIDIIDWNDSGGISVNDLEMLLETVGMKLSHEELQAMIREIDKDGNGEIDFQEFCETMTKKIELDHAPEEVASSFKAFSKSAPEGLIKVRDLRNSLITYLHREGVSVQEVDELLMNYRDCYITLPGSDVEYFNYQDYVDLMTPMMERTLGAASTDKE